MDVLCNNPVKEKWEKEAEEWYDSHPYPPRSPDSERSRLLYTWMDAIPALNHFCFRGDHKRFGPHFRALTIGGGTGDSTIYLAEQLRNSGGKVIYVDISSKAMKIAKQRARVRNLSNIEWIHASLFDLPNLNLEPFDYINCSGMLHHIHNPDEGVAVLRDQLKEDGAIGFLIYALYGRKAIHPMQKIVNMLITKQVDDVEERIDLTRELIADLPPTNLFKLLYNSGGWKGDLEDFGDVGLYGLLMQKEEKAYTVSEVYDLADRAKMHFVAFCGNDTQGMKDDPLLFLEDQDLRNVIAKMTQRERQEWGELFFGNTGKHCFYMSKQPNTPVNFNLHEFIEKGTGDHFIPTFGPFFSGEHLAKSMKPKIGGFWVVEQVGAYQHKIPVCKTTIELINKINGVRTIRNIIDEIIKETGKEKNKLRMRFSRIFDSFHRARFLFLR